MDVITLAVARKYTNSVALNGVPVQHPRINPTTGTWEIFNPISNSFVNTGIRAEALDPDELVSTDESNAFSLGSDNKLFVSNDGKSELNSYIHIQNTPSALWLIQHNFNTTHKAMVVFVVDQNNEQIIGQIDIGLSTNNLLAYRFGVPLSGQAYIRI